MALNKKFIVVAALLTFATIVAVTLLSNRSLTPLWNYDSEVHEKGPLMGIIDMNLLEDYFRFDHFGKTIKYQIKPKLHLNNFKNPLDEYHALEALNYSLKQTLNVKSEDREHLLNLLHKNLIEDFNRELLQQLTLHLVDHGQIDWLIQFSPEQKLNIQYHDELKRDGTLIWAPNSRLAYELYTPEKSLAEKIKDLSIPYTNQIFQYMAGEIRYLLHLSSQKNKDYFDPQIVGEIQYIKYYRINTNKPFETKFRSSGFQVDYARFRQDSSIPLLKVTAVSKFNSLQLIPQLRSLKIEFDREDEFLLSGKLTSEDKEFSFETFISKLYFNIVDNSLSHVNTDLTVIRTDLLPRGQRVEKEALYKHQISSKILREHARELMQMFSNREFSGSLSTRPIP